MVRICLVLALLPEGAGCISQDMARLAVDKLQVPLCRDGKVLTKEPFVLDADLLRWHMADSVAMVEMRLGYRATTVSDALYLTIRDVRGIQQRVQEKGHARVDLDSGDADLALLLLKTCPDFGAALVARNGYVDFTTMEPHEGGHIRGYGAFDLEDGRDPGAAPLGKGARLDFDFEVRAGPPYQDFVEPIH